MDTQGFTETSCAIARAAGVSVPTIHRYTSEGLLAHVIISDGTRLYRADAAETVKKLKAQRHANRGKRVA